MIRRWLIHKAADIFMDHLFKAEVSEIRAKAEMTNRNPEKEMSLRIKAQNAITSAERVLEITADIGGLDATVELYGEITTRVMRFHDVIEWVNQESK